MRIYTIEEIRNMYVEGNGYSSFYEYLKGEYVPCFDEELNFLGYCHD